MKKQTMYTHLQKQYTKLNQRIQKAMQTGRFYAYTQFKQEQLLSRLKRCSFQLKQLKQLGAGVAVVAALGMATPAVGQSSFLERTGTDNPCDLFIDDEWHVTFVDMDNDGDLDCFTTEYGPSIIRYYENTGSVSNPNYVLQTGTNNPFNGVADAFRISFVDIDGDGDQDCFFSVYSGLQPNGPILSYYENTGSATSPVFALQTLANNPLDMVRTTVGQGGLVSTTFVDIDNDGDMDCFVGDQNYKYTAASPSLLYYENTGTVTAPVFTQQLGGANPLSSVTFPGASAGFSMNVQFEDMDMDNDLDAFVSGEQGTGATILFKYYENTGNLGTPSFALNNITPLDSITEILISRKMTLVDIDNDMDIDVFKGREGDDPYFFWENRDVVSSISQLATEEKESLVYPNPTGGQLSFERPITGMANVYTLSGQLLLNLELFEEQSINLESLENGFYFLEIQTEKGRIREKVILQK